MNTTHLLRSDLGLIDLFLVKEQQRRGLAQNRDAYEDFVFVFEPHETFSINHERDLASVRVATQEAFAAYSFSLRLETQRSPLIRTHRGGGMMWHGPGQLCLAPLVHLERLKLNLPDYSCILEKTLLETLSYFGVNAVRNHYHPGAQGAWVLDPASKTLKKIGFFGWKLSRDIAIHGCTINVSPDLYPFSLIDPCNLSGVEVTSMAAVLKKMPSMNAVRAVFVATFIKELKSGAQSCGV